MTDKVTATHGITELYHALSDITRLPDALLLYLAQRALWDNVVLSTEHAVIPTVERDVDRGSWTYTNLIVPALINGLTGAIVGRYTPDTRGWIISSHT